MRSLRKLAPTFFALLLALPAAAQNTTTLVTLQHLLAHGQNVANAQVCAFPADANNVPINVSAVGWGLLLKNQPLCATVVNGALPNGLPVPDASHTTAAAPIRYNFIIQVQNANGIASGPAILLNGVPNISGPTFALDTYTPTVAVNVPPTGIVYTTGVPASCAGPSIVIDQAAPAAYMCQNGHLVTLSLASTAVHANSADTATSALTAGYATNAGSASRANTADGATQAVTAGYATTAGTATSATSATSAGTAASATVALALAATPTNCGAQAMTGIHADGSPVNCVSVSGGPGGSPAGALHQFQVNGAGGTGGAFGASTFLTDSTNSDILGVRNLTGQNTNGRLNADLFAVSGAGGAYNAVNNCSGANCLVEIPNTSPDLSQNIFALPLSSQYHVIDHRKNADVDYFVNPPFNPTNRYNQFMGKGLGCLWNMSDTSGSASDQVCHTRAMLSSGSGMNSNDTWNSHGLSRDFMASVRSGIAQVYNVSFRAYKSGDITMDYIYMNFRDFALTGADESTKAWGLHMNQEGSPVGGLEGVSGNLIQNGGFYNGLTDWNPNQPSGASVDLTVHKFGTQSLRAKSTQGVFQGVPLTPGHTYTLSGWVMTDGSVVGGGSLGSGFLVPDPNHQITVLSVTGGTQENLGTTNPAVILTASSATPWTYLSMTFTTAYSGITNIGLADNYGAASGTNNTWFDGMQLRDASISLNNNTSITLDTGGHLGQGFMLVSEDEVFSQGNIIGYTPATATKVPEIVTSDTHAVSTYIGTLASTCGALAPPDQPVSTKCSLATISGSIDVTKKVCIGDYVGPETSTIALDSDGVSYDIGMIRPHAATTQIFQGGACENVLVAGNGQASLAALHGAMNNAQYTSYWAVGSPTATSIAYVLEYQEGQDGDLQMIPPPSPLPQAGLTLTRAGGNVAATLATTQSTYWEWNGYTAPPAASIQVSACADPSFNGTIASTTADQNGIYWAQAGSNATTTGCTLQVLGLNNYWAVGGTQTTRVDTSGMDAFGDPIYTGTVGVMPNDLQWPAGGNVIQPNGYSSHPAIAAETIYSNTLPIGGANVARYIQMGGNSFSGGSFFQLEGGDSPSSYSGLGGKLEPHTFIKSGDVIGDAFTFFAPVNNHAVFHLLCRACSVNDPFVDLFALDGHVGNHFRYTPSNGVLSVTGTFAAKTISSSNFVVPDTLGTSAQSSTQYVSSTNTTYYNQGTATDTGNSSINLSAAGYYGANLYVGAQAPTSAGIYTKNQSGSGSSVRTYAVSALTANGESIPGAAFPTGLVDATFGSGTGQPYLYMLVNFLDGATGANVYRITGNGGAGRICANVTTASRTCVDNGQAPDGHAMPTTDTTGSAYLGGPLNIGGPITVQSNPAVTASGSSCTITAITDGIVTGAHCP